MTQFQIYLKNNKKRMIIRTRKNWKPVKIKATNLNDEQKKKVLKVAFNRYNLDELQELLNIKNNEY